MKTKPVLALLAASSWLLSACGPGQTPPTIAATAAPPTSTLGPTSTPIPPTATNTPFVPKATLKIAVAVPLSGDLGVFGTDILHGSELAVSALGKTLELMGYDVELVSYDDKQDWDTAVSNAKELVIDPDILCGVGHFNSRETIQASEVYHRAGLAFISPSATRAGVTKRGYLEVNRVMGRDDVQGAAGAHFAQARGFKTIFVIYNNKDPYTAGNGDSFKREASQLGLNIIGTVTTDALNGFDGEIGEILEANTELVFFAGFADQVGGFINEARNIGYTGAILGIDAALASPEILDFTGPFAIDGGLFYTNVGMNLASLPNADRFVQEFKSRIGTEPLPYTPYAYDATGICMEAIEAASTANGGEIPTRADVANAIRALIDYEGITGTYNFTSKGDPMLFPYQVLQVTTVDPNKWVANPVVGTYEVEPPE